MEKRKMKTRNITMEKKKDTSFCVLDRANPVQAGSQGDFSQWLCHWVRASTQPDSDPYSSKSSSTSAIGTDDEDEGASFAILIDLRGRVGPGLGLDTSCVELELRTRYGSRVCGYSHGMIRKYGLMCCRQCFHSNAKNIGFIKYR
ncbi:hypothetical protein RJ639_009440 [Escallonia herrerae]|uniref:40S ribosomal protein S29 n=1 Tax=Escallonia herrerae TaxID=1293975 RepID=A0AA88VTW7_9ASTE|nr:hypothetical protein RJ639_009440 [Escallonia herrerae]